MSALDEQSLVWCDYFQVVIGKQRSDSRVDMFGLKLMKVSWRMVEIDDSPQGCNITYPIGIPKCGQNHHV